MHYKTFNPLISAILVLTLVSLACGVSAPEPTPTNTPVPPTATETLVPSATPKPTITPRPTKTPNLAATQVMEENMTRIQSYFEKGYLPSTEGHLFKLEDVKMELAQRGYYSDLYPTGYDDKVTNFVFRADFKWENAESRPETSGCGFVYRLQDNSDFYSAYLDTERIVVGGYAASAGNFIKRFGVTSGSGRVDFGNPAQANFTFIMNGNMAYALVDDEFIGSYTLYTGKLLDPGFIAYILKSGTNKDYGTRCEITNATLWVVK